MIITAIGEGAIAAGLGAKVLKQLENVVEAAIAVEREMGLMLRRRDCAKS